MLPFRVYFWDQYSLLLKYEILRNWWHKWLTFLCYSYIAVSTNKKACSESVNKQKLQVIPWKNVCHCPSDICPHLFGRTLGKDISKCKTIIEWGHFNWWHFDWGSGPAQCTLGSIGRFNARYAVNGTAFRPPSNITNKTYCGMVSLPSGKSGRFTRTLFILVL